DARSCASRHWVPAPHLPALPKARKVTRVGGPLIQSNSRGHSSIVPDVAATYDDCRAHSPVDLPEIPAELTWSRLSICPTDPACQPRDRPGRANPDDSTRGAMTGTRLFTDSDAT